MGNTNYVLKFHYENLGENGTSNTCNFMLLQKRKVQINNIYSLKTFFGIVR